MKKQKSIIYLFIGGIILYVLSKPQSEEFESFKTWYINLQNTYPKLIGLLTIIIAVLWFKDLLKDVQFIKKNNYSKTYFFSVAYAFGLNILLFFYSFYLIFII